MSHIRKKEELLKLRDYLLNKEDVFSKEELYSILDFIIPKDEKGNHLTSFLVNNGKVFKVGYSPKYNIISIPKKSLEKLSLEGSRILQTEVDNLNIKKCIKYFELYALMHEVEHAYQFLISQNKILFEYSEVKEGYKNIADILKGRDYVLPHPITYIRDIISKYKYYKNDSKYIFERNASYEASNDIKVLASEMEDYDISLAFSILSLANLYIGYVNDNKGCMYNTHKNMYIMDRFNKIENDSSIPPSERVRYGLSIDEKERGKLLKKIVESNLE